MSYIEPEASGFELTASERDPAHHSIIPSNNEQDLAFRSIRAIESSALQPFGPVSVTARRETPKGVRPMIWVRLNETKSAVIFEATLHTGQCVQAHVPYESWRLATCDSEAVRAAIQRAYLNLLRRKPDPAIVRPGMISLKILSKHDPQHYALDSISTRAVLDSSRYTSSQNDDYYPSDDYSRSRTPQPPIQPQVLAQTNTGGVALGNYGRVQTPTPAQIPYYPYVQSDPIEQPYAQVKQKTVRYAEIEPRGNANRTNKKLPKNAVVGGDPPFEYRPDIRYLDPKIDSWARYYAQGGSDPAGTIYFHSVPGITEAATTSASPNKSHVPTHSAELAQDSREATSQLPAESPRVADGLPDLEILMQERVPLNLTGEVEVADYRDPKHGGFAFVYKGTWKGKEVAVKRLKCKKNPRKPALWESSMQRRLTREINVWAALSHRNIAEFLGFAEDFGDFPAMISTWYNQGTARDFLDDNDDIAIEVRIRIVQDVADGIEYLHRLKIIHGDLKPTNILIDDDDVAYLCDFGLVRLDDWQGPAGMTTTSPYTGTERYKAPELFITIGNSHPVATSEGDIWALGCISLEFVDTRIPYERYHHSAGLAKAIADGEPPASRPKTSDSDSLFSQHLWYILEACWAWYPENRFNASQIVEGLAQLSELQKVLSEAQ